MRNVVYGINMSIDAICDHTNFRPDDEIMEHFIRLLQGADLLVYGRKTYELMVPYWPDIAKSQAETKLENEFANTFTAIDKVVFSKTLQSVEGNARIVRGNLGDEIRKLKQQPGKNISVGGVSLPSQLMALGLIDEYHFVIHPGIVGDGRKLLEGISLPEKLKLKLVDCKVFKSGVLWLHYLKD